MSTPTRAEFWCQFAASALTRTMSLKAFDERFEKYSGISGEYYWRKRDKNPDHS